MYQSQIAKCICLKLQNVFVSKCICGHSSQLERPQCLGLLWNVRDPKRLTVCDSQESKWSKRKNSGEYYQRVTVVGKILSSEDSVKPQFMFIASFPRRPIQATPPNTSLKDKSARLILSTSLRKSFRFVRKSTSSVVTQVNQTWQLEQKREEEYINNTCPESI